MAIIKPKNNVKEIYPISERIFYEKCKKIPEEYAKKYFDKVVKKTLIILHGLMLRL